MSALHQNRSVRINRRLSTTAHNHVVPRLVGLCPIPVVSGLICLSSTAHRSYAPRYGWETGFALGLVRRVAIRAELKGRLRACHKPITIPLIRLLSLNELPQIDRLVMLADGAVSLSPTYAKVRSFPAASGPRATVQIQRRCYRSVLAQHGPARTSRLRPRIAYPRFGASFFRSELFFVHRLWPEARRATVASIRIVRQTFGILGVSSAR